MRGVFAKQDFHIGDEIIFVPYKTFLETKNGDIKIDSRLIDGKSPREIYVKESIFLSVNLLLQLQYEKESRLYHYIQTLPGTDDFPINYDQDTRKMLEGSPFL